jgi:hypothetical protein
MAATEKRTKKTTSTWPFAYNVALFFLFKSQY